MDSLNEEWTFWAGEFFRKIAKNHHSLSFFGFFLPGRPRERNNWKNSQYWLTACGRDGFAFCPRTCSGQCPDSRSPSGRLAGNPRSGPRAWILVLALHALKIFVRRGKECFWIPVLVIRSKVSLSGVPCSSSPTSHLSQWITSRNGMCGASAIARTDPSKIEQLWTTASGDGCLSSKPKAIPR